jgi:MYXO-CTERM domain-containing protein
MSIHICRTSFAVFGAAFAFAAPSTASAALLSHWMFDSVSGGVTPDSVGGVNGTLHGDAALVSGGVTGSAVSLVNYTAADLFVGGFNSARDLNDYVDMGAVYAFDDNRAFTMTAWIKPVTNGQPGHIAGNFIAPGAGGGYAMTANFGAGGSLSAVTGFPGAVAQAATTDPSRPPYDVYDGGWHQIVMSSSGGLTPTISLYVDGLLGKNGSADAISLGGPVGPNSFRHFMVGGYFFINRNQLLGSYDGLIDDVQLYDTALAGSDIASLFANPGQNLNQLNAPPSSAPAPAAAGLFLLGLGALATRRRVRV